MPAPYLSANPSNNRLSRWKRRLGLSVIIGGLLATCLSSIKIQSTKEAEAKKEVSEAARNRFRKAFAGKRILVSNSPGSDQELESDVEINSHAHESDYDPDACHEILSGEMIQHLDLADRFFEGLPDELRGRLYKTLEMGCEINYVDNEEGSISFKPPAIYRVCERLFQIGYDDDDEPDDRIGEYSGPVEVSEAYPELPDSAIQSLETCNMHQADLELGKIDKLLSQMSPDDIEFFEVHAADEVQTFIEAGCQVDYNNEDGTYRSSITVKPPEPYDECADKTLHLEPPINNDEMNFKLYTSVMNDEHRSIYRQLREGNYQEVINAIDIDIVEDEIYADFESTNGSDNFIQIFGFDQFIDNARRFKEDPDDYEAACNIRQLYAEKFAPNIFALEDAGANSYMLAEALNQKTKGIDCE